MSQEFTIMVTIHAKDQTAVNLARDEIVGSLEDLRDSGNIDDATVDGAECVPDARVVELARELYAEEGGQKCVAVYDDARMSPADDALWIEAWVRVDGALINDLSDSEGGHCD